MEAIVKTRLGKEAKGSLTVDQILSDRNCVTPSDRLRLAVLKVRSGIVAIK